MKCPKCKLENPPTAERCDCGYDFVSNTMKASYLELDTTGALRRVRSTSLVGSMLVGPSIAVAINFILALATSDQTLAAASIFPGGLGWLLGAVPVTLPGSLIGAKIAIYMAREKARPWTRCRWMVTGSLAGGMLAGLFTAAYAILLGGPLGMLYIALFLGCIVGAGITATAYRDLEALREDHAG